MGDGEGSARSSGPSSPLTGTIRGLPRMALAGGKAVSGPDARTGWDSAMTVRGSSSGDSARASGAQTIDAARTKRPGLRAVFTSGYTENSIVHQGKLDKDVNFLSKPFRRQELARKVRQTLDG